MTDIGATTINLKTIATCCVVLVPVVVMGSMSYSSILEAQSRLLEGQSETKEWMLRIGDKVDRVSDKVDAQSQELAEHERQLDVLQAAVNKDAAANRASQKN